MPKKGHKSTSGVGDLYDERKRNINLTLTPTAIDALEEKAEELELSKSEFIERIARGNLSTSYNQDTNEN
jgi:hypothetical protein